MRLDHNEIITVISRARTCPSILNCQRLQEMPLFLGDSLKTVPEKSKQVSGDRTERVTPVPIPNTEVKPLWADGTARATAWETRSLPGLNQKPLSPNGERGFLRSPHRPYDSMDKAPSRIKCLHECAAVDCNTSAMVQLPFNTAVLIACKLSSKAATPTMAGRRIAQNARSAFRRTPPVRSF